MMPLVRAIIVVGVVSLLMTPALVYSQSQIPLALNVQPGKNRSVVIQWNPRPETDSFDYVVEKSKDKITWKAISHKTAQLSHYYSTIDFNPGEGTIYYRIRQVIGNRQYSVSNINWIQIRNAGKLYIWPNPANEVLHVRSPFVNGTMDIVDEEGKFISKRSITNQVTDISMVGLSKGIYFLQVRHGKELLVEKFIKD